MNPYSDDAKLVDQDSRTLVGVHSESPPTDVPRIACFTTKGVLGSLESVDLSEPVEQSTILESGY
jgi:hypothetical protein